MLSIVNLDRGQRDLNVPSAVRAVRTRMSWGYSMPLRVSPDTPPPLMVEESVEPPPTAERSALMGRIRGKNTTPEMAVRRVAHSLGLRFRIHRRDLPGTPDLVLPKHRLIVFVHGCFWHRHEGCHRSTTPKTRTDFWEEKFRKNVERDRIDTAALVSAGWRVLTIWECQTRDPAALAAYLEAVTGRSAISRFVKPNR